MILEWRPSLPLSALHTCWCLANAAAPTAHAIFARANLHRYSQELLTASEDLSDACKWLAERAKGSFTVEALWLDLLADAAKDGKVNSERGELDETAAACIELYSQEHPDLLHQLELRSRPLKEQWEAHGPGLMVGMKHLLLGKEAPNTAFLVLPVLGGGGLLHGTGDSFHIEAVLANENPVLPEILRVAWLLAQANVAPDARSIETALLLIPATLGSAEGLGITLCDARITTMAIDNWLCPRTAQLDHLPSIAIATAVMRVFESIETADNWPHAIAQLRTILASL